MSWTQKLLTSVLAVSAISLTPLAFSASGQASMINMSGTTFGLDEQANISSPATNTTTISQNTGGGSVGASGGMQGWSNPGGRGQNGTGSTSSFNSNTTPSGSQSGFSSPDSAKSSFGSNSGSTGINGSAGTNSFGGGNVGGGGINGCAGAGTGGGVGSHSASVERFKSYL